MTIKTYRPKTPSRRFMTGIFYRNIVTRRRPEKSLTTGKKKTGGRNSKGRITVRHKGGGHKRLLRMIDFIYDKRDIPAYVKSVEYDPQRSGFIGLVQYKDGEKRYFLLPHGVGVGEELIVSERAELKPGNRTLLERIPVGSRIYNIELKPGSGAKLARSAGDYAEVLAYDAGYTHIKLPSGEIRKVPSRAWASMGEVAGGEHSLIKLGKAGRSRWKGIRPTVRGSAMNAVDHPYGGGEGKALRGTKRPKNKWGKGIRGKKTRKIKKYSNIFILQRRKKKKR